MDWGFFAQDDWKALPNLTLNLGIRYDYEQLPKPILVNSAYPGTANMPSDKNNISPRLGFAYDPFGKGKSVIRGGFGLYYGHITNALLLTTRITNGAAGGQTAYTIAPSTTAPRIPTTPTSFTASSALPDVQYLDKNLANPYSEQFDLAIQQDLGHGNVFQVAYLGSLGRQLPNSLNLNLNPSATYTVNYTVGGTSNCGPIACGTTFPVTVYAGSTVGGTSTLLNTGVNAAYSAISNINSSFHAMTVEFQNRGGKYFSYDLNYTWSHAHDYAQFSVTGLGSNNWFDPYANPGSNYGNSFLNVPHRVVGWAIFNIPGPKSGVMKYLAGGWSIKPALQAQSGLPYTATINSFTPPNQCAASTCYKSFTSGLSGTGVTYIPYIGRNTFRYSPDLLVDMRAQKDFHITERMRFELVAESFNLLNYQNITGVNTQAYSVSGSTLSYNTSFQAVQNVNNNFAYGPRTLQVGGRLFF